MVKCADCGFLAARNITTRGLDEVEKSIREAGMHIPVLIGQKNWESGIQPSRYEHEVLLVCFIQKYNLISEVEPPTPERPTAPANVFPVIQKERDCGDSFTKWQQGFTPKEIERCWIEIKC